MSARMGLTSRIVVRHWLGQRETDEVTSPRLALLHPTFPGEARVSEMIRSFWEFTASGRRSFAVQVVLSLTAFALVAAIPLQVGNLLSTALSAANAEREVARFVNNPEELRRSTERLLLPTFETTAERRAAFEAIRATEIEVRASNSDELLDALFPNGLTYDGERLDSIDDPEDGWEVLASDVLNRDRIGRDDLESLVTTTGNAPSLDKSRAFTYAVNVLLVEDAAKQQRESWRNSRFLVELIRFALVVLGVFVLRALVLLLATRNTLRAARRLQDAVFRQVHDSALVDAGALARPSMVSRCTSYVDKVQDALLKAQVEGIPDIAALVLSTAVLIYIDTPIGLMMMGVLALFEVIRRLISGRWSRLAHERLDLNTAMSEVADDAIAAAEGTRAARSESMVRARFAGRADAVARYTRRLEAFGEGFRISAFGLGQISVMIAIAIVGFLRNDLSLGEAAAVVLYVREVSNALDGIPSMVVELQEASPYMRRLRRVLGAERRRTVDAAAATPNSAARDYTVLQVKGVSFQSPDDSSRCVDVHLTARVGTWTVLTGGPDSGIDAVLGLIAGLETAERGRVLLGDIDLSLCSYDDLAHAISVLAKHPSVFEGSVAQNIAWPETAYAAERIRSTAEQVGLGEWLEAQPDGLDTVVGQSRQRLPHDVVIGINAARVLMSDAPLVVVNDPTDAMDRELADTIWRALRQGLSDRVVVMATDRLDLIDDADEVVCLESGGVVERGRRADLLAASSTFARLWQRLVEGSDTADDLARVSTFAALSPETLRELSERLVVERFGAGDLIFDEGDAADRVYLVADGIVDLFSNGQRVASAHRGFHFGEFAAEAAARRTTAARARTPVVLRSLHRLAVSRGLAGMLDRPDPERVLYSWLVRHGVASRDDMAVLSERLDVDAALAALVADGTVTRIDEPDGTERYRVAGSRRQTIRSRGVLEVLSDS